jgi:hypothetical protein
VRTCWTRCERRVEIKVETRVQGDSLNSVPGDTVLRGSIRVWDFADRTIVRARQENKVGGDQQIQLGARVDTVRVEAVQRWIVGPLVHQLQPVVKFGDAAGRTPRGRSHLRDEEASGSQRQELIGDARLRRTGGKQELGRARPGDVEEENAGLPTQEAQEAAASEDILVSREVAVVRLVADIPGRRERDRINDLTVVVRVLVEVNHREEIGMHARLIARPDVERLLRLGAAASIAELLIIAGIIAGIRSTRVEQQQRGEQQSSDTNKPPTSHILLPLFY